MHGIMSGESMARWTNEKWKREINRRVQDTRVDKWHRSMQAKSSLEYYLAKPKPKSETFYDGSVGGALLFKARTKSLEVFGRIYRWMNEGSKLCKMCDRGVDQTMEHLLVKCSGYERERRVMVNAIRQEIGDEKWNEITEWMEWDVGRLTCFLLGLGILDIATNRTLESVKIFLEKAWERRGSQLERRPPTPQ